MQIQENIISLRYQIDITQNLIIMENKEFAFKGMVMNGFLALFINFVVMVLAIAGIVYSIITLDNSGGNYGGCSLLI